MKFGEMKPNEEKAQIKGLKVTIIAGTMRQQRSSFLHEQIKMWFLIIIRRIQQSLNHTRWKQVRQPFCPRLRKRQCVKMTSIIPWLLGYKCKLLNKKFWTERIFFVVFNSTIRSSYHVYSGPFASWTELKTPRSDKRETINFQHGKCEIWALWKSILFSTVKTFKTLKDHWCPAQRGLKLTPACRSHGTENTVKSSSVLT